MVNILPADTYTVINKTILTDQTRKILTMLYQPIIGSVAINLFFTLWMDLDKDEFMSCEETHHHLITNTGLTLQELLIAREKLEAIGLLKTFYKEDKEENNYIYELFSPLEPNEFFSHPVLNIVLYNSVGKKEYERIVSYFKVPRVNLNDYEDITVSFSEVYESKPITVFENNIQNIREKTSLGLNIKDKIDIELLISSLSDESINKKTFTKDNKVLINDLAFIYNLELDEMKNIILNSLNDRLLIDKTNLRKNARNYYQYQNSGRLPFLIYQNQPEYLRSPIGKDTKRAKNIYLFETLSPYKFIKMKNGGKEPNDRDLKLIEELRIDMGLEPAVINVLIDYVLRVNNQKLTKNFVLAIASQWQRLKIETAEDAMNQALKETKKKTKTTSVTYSKKEKSLPEWFSKESDKEDTTTSEEEEMKDLLKGFN